MYVLFRETRTKPQKFNYLNANIQYSMLNFQIRNPCNNFQHPSTLSLHFFAEKTRRRFIEIFHSLQFLFYKEKAERKNATHLVNFAINYPIYLSIYHISSPFGGDRGGFYNVLFTSTSSNASTISPILISL